MILFSGNTLPFHVVLFRLKMICYQIFCLPINLILTTQQSTKTTILHSGYEEDWDFRNVLLLSPFPIFSLP